MCEQQVILFSAQNEYTDWSLPTDNLMSKLDSLIDILSDSLVIGPLTHAANLHYKHQQRRFLEQQNSTQPASGPSYDKRTSGSSKSSMAPNNSPAKSFFYVFSYQSEKSLFSQRLGSVHGDELTYLFGAPIASQFLSSFGSFYMNHTNFSKPEILLSQSLINYFANFAKFGNPNGNITTPFAMTSSSDVIWPEYDASQRKYMSMGIRPKIRDHYRTHRLSFWTHLVPKLQNHGKEESERIKQHLTSLQDQEKEHHNRLKSNDPSSSADSSSVAVFERISLKFLNSLDPPSSSSSGSSDTSKLTNEKILKMISSTPVVPSATLYPNIINNFETTARPKSKSSILSVTPSSLGEYSTALTITIVIGLSLLFLNIIVFVGVFYKLHKKGQSLVDRRHQTNTQQHNNRSSHSKRCPNHNNSNRRQQQQNSDVTQTSDNHNRQNNCNSLKRVNGTHGHNNHNATQVVNSNSLNRNRSNRVEFQHPIEQHSHHLTSSSHPHHAAHHVYATQSQDGSSFDSELMAETQPFITSSDHHDLSTACVTYTPQGEVLIGSLNPNMSGGHPFSHQYSTSSSTGSTSTNTGIIHSNYNPYGQQFIYTTTDDYMNSTPEQLMIDTTDQKSSSHHQQIKKKVVSIQEEPILINPDDHNDKSNLTVIQELIEDEHL